MSSPPNTDRVPRISARGLNFVQIIAGPEEIIFNVHEKLLTHHSPFFQSALTGPFREASDKEVLPVTDPNTVEFFIRWLYHQRFPGPSDDAELHEF